MAITISLFVLVVILAYFAWRFSIQAAHSRAKYASIVDIDKAVGAAKQDLERVRQEQRTAEQEHERTLDTQLQAATGELDRVRRDRAFLAQVTKFGPRSTKNTNKR